MHSIGSKISINTVAKIFLRLDLFRLTWWNCFLRRGRKNVEINVRDLEKCCHLIHANIITLLWTIVNIWVICKMPEIFPAYFLMAVQAMHVSWSWVTNTWWYCYEMFDTHSGLHTSTYSNGWWYFFQMIKPIVFYWDLRNIQLK